MVTSSCLPRRAIRTLVASSPLIWSLAGPGAAAAPADPKAPANPPGGAADPQGAATSDDSWKWLTDSDRLTGTWCGARKTLEDHGIKNDFYVNEYFAAKDNGGASGSAAAAQSGSFDWFATINFEKLGLWKGGELLAQTKSNWGWNINNKVGALSDPIDDADGDHPIYIDQLWYGHSTANKRLQVRIGYLDHQVLLDRNAYANNEDRQFMSTFLDNNNAIIPLKIGPAAAVLYNPTDWVGFVGSVANSDAQLFHSNLESTFQGDCNVIGFVETDFRVHLPGGPSGLLGNYRFGALLDGRDKPVFGSTVKEDVDPGFYLSFDQQVWAESSGSSQGLGLFARYGWRPGHVNRIEHFWSVGAQYQGPIPSRDRDVLGFGMFSAIGSDAYRVAVNPDFDCETGYEMYYSFQATPAIAVSAAGQFIEQPGGLTTRNDVWIFALRFRLIL